MLAGKCEYDFVILVDSSGSVIDPNDGGAPGNWDLVLDMLKRLIEVIDSYSEIGASCRIAIINYSTNQIIELRLEDNYNRQQIIDKINSGAIMHQNAKTYMTNALRLADELLHNSTRLIGGDVSAAQAVMLFTDGQAREADKALAVLKSFMDRGIYAIMIGKSVQRHTLFTDGQAREADKADVISKKNFFYGAVGPSISVGISSESALC